MFGLTNFIMLYMRIFLFVWKKHCMCLFQRCSAELIPDDKRSVKKDFEANLLPDVNAHLWSDHSDRFVKPNVNGLLVLHCDHQTLKRVDERYNTVCGLQTAHRMVCLGAAVMIFWHLEMFCFYNKTEKYKNFKVAVNKMFFIYVIYGFNRAAWYFLFSGIKCV